MAQDSIKLVDTGQLRKGLMLCRCHGPVRREIKLFQTKIVSKGTHLYFRTCPCGTKCDERQFLSKVNNILPFSFVKFSIFTLLCFSASQELKHLHIRAVLARSRIRIPSYSFLFSCFFIFKR